MDSTVKSKPPVNTRKHAAYAKPYLAYAQEFDSGARAIKGWVKFGKQNDDLPPLDRPAEMAAWWARVMKHSVPEKLLALSRSPIPPSDSPQPNLPPAAPRDFSHIRGLDLNENVQELRRTLAIDKYLLDEAKAGREESLVALRERNYKSSFELLRKAEITLQNLQQGSGNLIDRDSVEVELAQILESLRIMRETMPRRILAEFERLLPRRLARVFRIIERFLVPAVEKVRLAEEEIFRNLRSFESPDAIRSLLAA